MSVTDIVRTIAKTVTHPSELKEKAKDLPLNVLQTALTGVGQALMLGDRIRTGIKRLLSEDDRAASEVQAGGPAASPVVEEDREEKPARREPVIFAPRPSTPGDSLNGSTPKTESTVTVPPTAPAPDMRPAPAAQPEAAPAAQPEAAAPPKPKAKAGAAEPKPRTRKPRATAGKLADAVRNDTAPEATAPAATPSVVSTPAAGPAPSPAGTTSTLAEPLPGYSDLTMASLRARLRGKSADQIRSLIEYERQTSDRHDIVQMYAKRLTKLESGE
ncbi:hypothetical protein AB0O34_16145 [Sphaerisporangium sp. NPDC088356]|uniref:hypothetical protein n=1 Tax=Sphaerisporangium sp. NPDC088356 TaxID=3154871 RepID=UPI00341AB53A